MGREANLVVDDYVDGSPSTECARLGHLEGFHDHALTGKGGVAMNDDGQHLLVVVVQAPVLPRAHAAFDYGCHDFEM